MGGVPQARHSTRGSPTAFAENVLWREMLGKCERRVSVPPGYLALGDATYALIAVETGGQEPAMEHLSDEELTEANKRWHTLKARLISAIQEGVLVPYGWNRKD